MFDEEQDLSASMSTDDGQENVLDEFPIADPLAELPETARELLFAAQRVIAKEGLHKLTLARLGKESGQNTALVAYYFGNKMGLLERVVESIIHDECLETTNRIRNLPEGAPSGDHLLRVEALERGGRGIHCLLRAARLLATTRFHAAANGRDVPMVHSTQR